MSKRFEGKTALVTGGSRGIGKGIVEALIKEGAKVYALAKSKENLEKLKSEIPSVNTVQVDLRDWEKTRKAVECLGVVDLLVNNAGDTTKFTDFYEVEKEEFDKLIDINFSAAFNVSRVVTRGLISTGRPGAVVNMSSIYGIAVSPKGVAYCVPKAMLEMLTKVMALELGPNHIRVNSISPTFVRTELTREYINQCIDTILKRHPLGKIAEIKDVVDATLFLLSDEASMITGTSLPVDGGFLIS